MRSDVEFFASQNDLSTWISYALFGDAACAFVLSGSENAGEVLDGCNAGMRPTIVGQ